MVFIVCWDWGCRGIVVIVEDRGWGWIWEEEGSYSNEEVDR